LLSYKIRIPTPFVFLVGFAKTNAFYMLVELQHIKHSETNACFEQGWLVGYFLLKGHDCGFDFHFSRRSYYCKKNIYAKFYFYLIIFLQKLFYQLHVFFASVRVV